MLSFAGHFVYTPSLIIGVVPLAPPSCLRRRWIGQGIRSGAPLQVALRRHAAVDSPLLVVLRRATRAGLVRAIGPEPAGGQPPFGAAPRRRRDSVAPRGEAQFLPPGAGPLRRDAPPV